MIQTLPISFHRATVDPTPNIDRPAGGIEVFRTMRGCQYLLPSGKMRQILSIGVQHYHDGEYWRRVNCNLEGLELWRAPYFFKAFEAGIGATIKRRSGGWSQMRLTHADGQRVLSPRPRPEANCVHWEGIARDCSAIVQCVPHTVRGWTILDGPHAPRRFTWEFLSHHKPKRCRVRGVDAVGNVCEIKTHRHTTTIRPGLYRTVVEKRWTGRVWDDWTREWKAPVYPVSIDPDISEEIVAEGDDGFGDGSSTWTDTSVGHGKVGGSISHPGWRFQTIPTIVSGDTIDLTNFKINVTFTQNGGTTGTLQMADVDDHAAWSNSNRPDNVAATTASTSAPWTSTGQKTHDITTANQEVVDRGSYGADADVGVFAANNPSPNTRCSMSDYDSSGNHGRLEIDFTAAGGGAAPPWMGLQQKKRRQRAAMSRFLEIW